MITIQSEFDISFQVEVFGCDRYLSHGVFRLKDCSF